jgi:hypothetical protein
MLKFRSLNSRGCQWQFLALLIFYSLRPCFLTPLVFAFRSPVSAFSLSAFQLFASYPGVGIEFGHGEKLVAGLFDRVFHPQPVEQRALGLLLAGCDLGQAPNEIGSNRRSALFHL